MPEPGVVYNNSSNIDAANATSSTISTDSHVSSYTLNRFLSEPNHTPGYRSTQNPAEAEKQMLDELRKFEAKFASSSETPKRS
ncbi:hypothetical protein GGI42DRAFT_362536 [Trichoderma sp. SZMC 28013]